MKQGGNIMEQKIIKEYLQGKSILQLSKEYPISYGKIQKILRQNQIVIRGGRKKKELTPEQLREFKEDLLQSKTYKELEQKYKLDEATLKRIKDEQGFQKKSQRVNKRILDNYFSNIDTQQKAYWLGFLFTDGSVDHYHKTGRIRLQLQNQDQEILEQFKEDLQLDCQIIYDKRPNKKCCSIEFTNEQIFNDLNTYGIIPNKTYDTHHLPFDKIPNELKPAFILGLLDGDGGLSCSQNYSTDVTLNFTTYHQSVALELQQEIDKLINKSNHSKVFFTSAWHTQWRGRLQVLSILDILYENCPRHLKRKYNIYLALKNSF